MPDEAEMRKKKKLEEGRRRLAALRGKKSRETKGGAPHGPYKVTVTVTSPGFSAVARGSYDNPGAYKLSAKIPNRRARGRCGREPRARAGQLSSGSTYS